MTDEEMIENLQCVVNDISEQCNKLNAENAALRENRTKSVKEVAERIKTAFYCEFEELIPSIMADKIDEIVKEVLNEHEL